MADKKKATKLIGLKSGENVALTGDSHRTEGDPPSGKDDKYMKHILAYPNTSDKGEEKSKMEEYDTTAKNPAVKPKPSPTNNITIAKKGTKLPQSVKTISISFREDKGEKIGASMKLGPKDAGGSSGSSQKKDPADPKKNSSKEKPGALGKEEDSKGATTGSENLDYSKKILGEEKIRREAVIRELDSFKGSRPVAKDAAPCKVTSTQPSENSSAKRRPFEIASDESSMGNEKSRDCAFSKSGNDAEGWRSSCASAWFHEIKESKSLPSLISLVQVTRTVDTCRDEARDPLLFAMPPNFNEGNGSWQDPFECLSA